MLNSNPQYEMTFILGEKANLEEGNAKTEQLKKFIADHGGEVSKEEPWGRRELAYPIKRNRTGYYVTMWFTLPAPEVRILEEELRFDETVIRSMVTKAYTEAQPGSLYPVVEEEKTEKTSGSPKDEKVSGEEMVRRNSGAPKKEKPAAEDVASAIPEEERLKKLDERLEELLKDEEK
jgi:small subunit ribosomal protein S6